MNQFSVQPLGGFDIVGAAGNALNDYRTRQDAEAQQLKKQEISNQAVALMEANDAAGMAELMLRNPEMKASIDAAQGYKNDTTKGYRRDALMRIISGEDHTSVAEETAMKIEAAGGIADHTRSYAALPKEQALSMAKMELAGMDPNAYKAYAQSQGGGSNLPSAVKETEWFLKQPEEVQKRHIELKRKTDPTLAEKLQYELDKKAGQLSAEADSATDKRFKEKLGESGAKVYTDLQQSAQQASAFIPRLKSLRGLASKVETGTGAEIKLAAKKALGLESSDMEELNAKLGELAQDILNQQTGTKTDFDFQNAVRQSAALGKTKEANARLINALIDRQLEAVSFGDMAKEAYEKDGVKGVLDMRFSESQAANGGYQGQDLEAYNWAKANQGDPRAAAILQKLGAQ